MNWTQFLFYWAEMPVTRQSERHRNRLCGAKRPPSRAHHPGLIGPPVGTPPITIGENPFGFWVVYAFERQGACAQLVPESCASAASQKLVNVGV